MRSHYAWTALAVFCLTFSCGGRRGVLAVVGGSEITEGDFVRAFDLLSPAEQVRVLEPGGRLALLDRLVTKRVLELSLGSADTSGASFWTALYEDAWLADRWRQAAFSAFRDSSEIDEEALSRQARLRIVLVPDSTTAARCASEWSSESWSPPAVTSLAPWSAGGSSYRVLEGPLFALPPDLAGILLPAEGGGPSVFRLYGVWAAAELNLGERIPDSLPHGAADMLAFESLLRRESGIRPSSTAIEALSRNMRIGEDGRYTLAEPVPGEPGGALVEWDGGSIEASEVARLLREVRPSAFFDGVPPELEAVAAPSPSPAGPGVDLWFYLTGLARRRWEADMGRASGLDPDTAEVAVMARVEHMLRRNVLETLAPPDSSKVMSFFERHRGELQIPERRSVLIAYVPSETADSLGSVEDFGVVSDWAPAGPDGAPLATPPQPPEAFGPLAEAVFTAPEGVVTGPLPSSVENLSAYVQVVSIIPAGTADPVEIWPLLEEWAAREALVEAYGAYTSELRSRFGVEIDSSAVESVDPWGGDF